jgi:hypothetical protein
MMIGPPCHSNSPSDFIMDTIFSTNFCIAACRKKKREKSGTSLPPQLVQSERMTKKKIGHNKKKKQFKSLWVKLEH